MVRNHPAIVCLSKGKRKSLLFELWPTEPRRCLRFVVFHPNAICYAAVKTCTLSVPILAARPVIANTKRNQPQKSLKQVSTLVLITSNTI